MLLLYRPRQTWMPYSLPRDRTQQAEYNRQLHKRFASTRSVAPGVPAGRERDLIGDLKELGALHQSGLLTDTEFAAAKAKLLANMTSNDARATTLVRALRAGIEGNRHVLQGILTDDVRAWTPALSTASLAELIDELDHRSDVFSDIELQVAPLDVGGDYACVEWSVALTHTGRLTLDDETNIEPTGMRIVLHGATVAEFRGERICSLRQYWDEHAVLEQLGVAPNR